MYSVNTIVDPLSPLQRSAFNTAQSFVPLKSLRHGFLEELFLSVVPQSIVSGEIIFEAGAYDGQVIYLSAGSVALEYPSGRIEQIDAGSAILPLANQQPRPCKASATVDCTIIRIDADLIDRTLSWSQMTDYLLTQWSMDQEYQGYLEWIKTVLRSNLFFKVPSVNAQQIFERFTPMVVERGEVIIQQGDMGDCCYFLKEGKAIVEKKLDNSMSEKIAEILPGRCFGEDALIERKPRNATVVMAEDGLLMRLEKNDFLRLFKEPEVEEISAEELDELQHNPILIDVRTDAEYRSSHLAFSANIPISVLILKKRLLSLEQAYVLYCDTGRRSRAAGYFLGKEGFNVVSLKGGLNEQNLLDCMVDSPSYMLKEGVLAESED